MKKICILLLFFTLTFTLIVSCKKMSMSQDYEGMMNKNGNGMMLNNSEQMSSMSCSNHSEHHSTSSTSSS